MTCGVLIRAARKRAGLSQHALAVELGVCPSTMAGVEFGRRPPTAEQTRRLLKILPNLVPLELWAAVAEGKGLTEIAELLDEYKDLVASAGWPDACRDDDSGTRTPGTRNRR